MIFLFNTKSHYPDNSFFGTHSKIEMMAGQGSIGFDAWYDVAIVGHHINKLVGFTLDKKITINFCGIWNHRNSIRIGWKPSVKYGSFNLYIYLHKEGCAYLPKPLTEILIGSIKAMKDFDWNISLDLFGVPSVAIQQGENTFHYKSLDEIKFPKCESGYILSPYYGGKPLPPNDFKIYCTILKQL